eukprot:TRINITY_DN41651_c0_g3_i1.p1 TRINITY_DN41651_c0_g3~~TRINITY_DN41651_c0_g3_i1.p1  ORF type:complete len:511 (+),score=115.94 TRINITY_DN41651_c0_g3_i1:131-1663(+)
MAAASGRATRAALFVFDPTLTPDTPKPSEEDCMDAKIVYYSPSCAPPEEKRSHAGLIEGLIQFADMFGTGDKKAPLKCLRTKQLAFSVLEVEPHTWMVLAMRHPQVPSTGGAKDEQKQPQYDEEGLADSTLMAVMRNCYAVFRLLHGELQTFLREHSSHKLFDLLEDFIPAFLETVDASDLGIFQELDGFHYGPVERNTCISIHCALLKLQEQFPMIRNSALLYNAHLIYASFSLDDMKVLYSYLVSFNGAVSNSKLNKPPYGRIPTAASQPGGGSSSFGRACLLTEDQDFLLGASSGQRQKGGSSTGPSSIFVPAVHLTEDGPGQLVALVYNGIMLILIFEENAQLDARLLDNVRTAATAHSGDGLSLSELHPLIAEQYAQVMQQEDTYRFAYYNSSNHALRLSNQPTPSRSLLGGSSRSANAANAAAPGGLKAAERQALCQLHAALAEPRLPCREVSLKSADRGWICAKRWREREFYLLLDGPNMSLSKCQEEVARFAQIHFSNIFMM